MTVPTLMQNYQRQSYVTQLHKIYNELSQAAVQYQTEKNAVNLKEAGLTTQAAAENFIEKYFKVVQNCSSDRTPCFPAAGEYKKLSGTTITTWPTPKTHYVIAGGSSIAIGYRPMGDVLCEIFVDVNGQKGPNIVGRDLFAIYLYNNSFIDDSDVSNTATAPMSKDKREDTYQKICTSNTANNWHGCFGKIINDNWEMTY